MDTPKLQLHIQLSLRITWSLTEKIFSNQGYKERPHQYWQEMERHDLFRGHIPYVMAHRIGRLFQLQRFPPEKQEVSAQPQTPQSEEMSTHNFWLWKAAGPVSGKPEGHRKLRFFSWMLRLTHSKSQCRGQLKKCLGEGDSLIHPTH